MTMYDLIIRGGILVTVDGPSEADFAVADGRIVAIAPDLEGSGKKEVDARELHVFPGAIDAHAHFNEPGRTHWEGFAPGTRALAAGGMTAYVKMPLNAHPPTCDADSFVLRAEDLFYRHKMSPYVGCTFRGRIVRTILRGTTDFRNGKVVSELVGRLLTPQRSAGMGEAVKTVVNR
ncbi:MAG: amidohydrolase family protein [Actinobacteria bacterium]|nr:amidohydrolase family protein [Actinomycetota bacterium]